MTTSESAASAADGAVLRARNLCKSFNGTSVLRDCAVEVHAGEVLAIMGPSGSGKSTLLHCLAGVLSLTSGSVQFGNIRLEELNGDARSRLRLREFGFVFQFGQLVYELTALQNAALSLLLRGVPRRESLLSAQACLDSLGVGGLRDRRVGELSGGEAQRVAVARAMAGRPSILFADEPTGSLDSRTGHEVMSAICGTAREQHTSLLLITHDQNIASWADRTVTIQDGSLTPAKATTP